MPKTPTMILFNGREMSADWPAKIAAAQHIHALHEGAVAYPRIPWGRETFWQEESALPTWPCRDCGVMPGQLHVPSCCVEACPRCQEGQRLTCDMEGCHP